MGRIQLAFLVLVLLSASSSCAQAKRVVKKTHAFYFIQHRGTIKQDANGNDAEPGFYPVYKIFIETNKSVKWVDAKKGANRYNMEVLEVKEKPFEVGTSEQSSQTIVINPAKGHKLYMLTLTPANEWLPVDTSKAPKLILTGLSGSKQLSVFVDNFLKLALKRMPK